MGIGTLLEDGLGDTIRVSLTEEPEAEIPVARALAERYDPHRGGGTSDDEDDGPIRIHYRRTHSRPVSVIGGDHPPRVVADLRGVSIATERDLAGIGHFYDPVTDKWTMTDTAAEFVIMGDKPLPFMPPTGIRQVVDADVWVTSDDRLYTVPLWTVDGILTSDDTHPVLNIVEVDIEDLSITNLDEIRKVPNVVLIITTDSRLPYHEFRNLFAEAERFNFGIPVVLSVTYSSDDLDQDLLHACTDVGSILADGFGDGVCISVNAPSVNEQERLAFSTRLSFGILQATRLRMTRTEYISCPSCGRTLFDLQETTALIRSHTDHLKGVKIGIMGCIVNGPGEMADADYGYVGSGPGKITLYRGQEIVKRAVPTDQAVDELIHIIRDDGRWIERG